MARPFLYSVLALILGAASPTTAAPPQESAPRREPDEPKEGDVHVGYWGLVTDLTKDSITIQFDNQKDRKPKTFAVSETLAAGKIPKEPRKRLTPLGELGYPVSPSHMYRLTDVKVGDWVGILYSRVGGVDICDHICIQKRPGGRIPPLPEEAENLTRIECTLSPQQRAAMTPEMLKQIRDRHIRYDEYWNAYWDLEDKGIPYPEKFGDKRRFPEAPMPREGKPLVPVIGP